MDPWKPLKKKTATLAHWISLLLNFISISVQILLFFLYILGNAFCLSALFLFLTIHLSHLSYTFFSNTCFTTFYFYLQVIFKI